MSCFTARMARARPTCSRPCRSCPRGAEFVGRRFPKCRARAGTADLPWRWRFLPSRLRERKSCEAAKGRACRFRTSPPPNPLPRAGGGASPSAPARCPPRPNGARSGSMALPRRLIRSANGCPSCGSRRRWTGCSPDPRATGAGSSIVWFSRWSQATLAMPRATKRRCGRATSCSRTRRAPIPPGSTRWKRRWPSMARRSPKRGLAQSRRSTSAPRPLRMTSSPAPSFCSKDGTAAIWLRN